MGDKHSKGIRCSTNQSPNTMGIGLDKDKAFDSLLKNIENRLEIGYEISKVIKVGDYTSVNVSRKIKDSEGFVLSEDVGYFVVTFSEENFGVHKAIGKWKRV